VHCRCWSLCPWGGPVQSGALVLQGQKAGLAGKSLVWAPCTLGFGFQSCDSRVCAPGRDICPLWASVTCRHGLDERRSWQWSGPRRSCPPSPPPSPLLFKVAVVWLALFLKTIPVLELSSTRPAVTTKNVCRVTATSEEVGGGRRPRMGPWSGWN
jgi:hypothetical protein